jgi:hypothetical protein
MISPLVGRLPAPQSPKGGLSFALVALYRLGRVLINRRTEFHFRGRQGIARQDIVLGKRGCPDVPRSKRSLQGMRAVADANRRVNGLLVVSNTASKVTHPGNKTHFRSPAVRVVARL